MSYFESRFNLARIQWLLRVYHIVNYLTLSLNYFVFGHELITQMIAFAFMRAVVLLELGFGSRLFGFGSGFGRRVRCAPALLTQNQQQSNEKNRYRQERLQENIEFQHVQYCQCRKNSEYHESDTDDDVLHVFEYNRHD